MTGKLSLQPVDHLTIRQREDLWELWNAEFPVSVAYPDVPSLTRYLEELEQVEYLLLLDKAGKVRGLLFTFIRDGNPWFGMALSRQWHGQGYGTQLLDHAKTQTDTLYGWAIDHDQEVRGDGSPYPSPIGFYRKNGFTVLEDQRLETDKISAVKICWVKNPKTVSPLVNQMQ